LPFRYAETARFFYMRKIYIHILFLCLGFSLKTHAQLLFHQDVFYGGVTAGGYSTGLGAAGNTTFDLYIEPGSTVRKAFLFLYKMGNPPSGWIHLNSNVLLHEDFTFLLHTEHTNPFASPVSFYVKDVTELIDPTQTSVFLALDLNSSGPQENWGWWCPVLYIEYENPDLDKVTTSLWVNDLDLLGNEIYTFNDMNPINTANPVGLSIFMDRGCLVPFDATEVYVENTYIGSIGEPDSLQGQLFVSQCGGSKGHFYYQNSTLYGLNDDYPTPTMQDADAIADIGALLPNNSQGYELRLTHNLHPVPENSGLPNVNIVFPHAYTTPCDTFSTQVLFADTTICRGDTIQLGVSGGNNYYWTNPNNMSGEQTANPLVWPDSTTLYVVRIEDEPGCSRTEHVLVRVNELPQITNLEITPTICGEESGNMVVSVEGESPFVYSIGSGNQGSAQFSGLAVGTYPLTVTDQNGCTTDTLVVIEEEINVVAQFSATPPTGAEPLDVSFLNNSQNANNFEWYIGNDFWDNSFNTSALFDSSGVYQVMLIAYNNQPHCADTAWFTVIVQDTLVVRIPNIFTPNNDGVNDVFTIDIRGAVHLSATVQNRWGNEMMQLEQSLTPDEQTVPIWNGFSQTTELASPGVYFYHLEITDTKEEEHVFSGFVHLVR
jgi:gliding motility-associated-like protein